MRKIKYLFGKLSLALVLEMAVATVLLATPLAAFEPSGDISKPKRTQPGGTRASIPTQWEPNRYRPPRHIGRPERTGQAGTRGPDEEQDVQEIQPTLQEQNAEDKSPLIAIVPDSSQGFGITSQSHPTFLVFVSELSEESETIPVEFALVDEEDNDVYRAYFSIDTKSQLVALTLPNDAGMLPLEVGKNYRWSFMLIKAPSDWSQNPVASGWVQRINPSLELTQALANASDHEQAKVYAHQEIWYDAIAALTKLQRENPQDQAIAQDWVKLLTAAGLERVSFPKVSSR